MYYLTSPGSVGTYSFVPPVYYYSLSLVKRWHRSNWFKETSIYFLEHVGIDWIYLWYTRNKVSLMLTFECKSSLNWCFFILLDEWWHWSYLHGKNQFKSYLITFPPPQQCAQSILTLTFQSQILLHLWCKSKLKLLSPRIQGVNELFNVESDTQ